MAKKAITIIASVEAYSNLSTFTTIEELNQTVRSYKKQLADQLTKSTLKVLDHLHRYSAKYLGVSFCSKNNIAQTLNISRKTVIRACQKLEVLGVIKQLETKRRTDMRQTTNAIIIQPIEQIVPQEEVENEGKCPTKKTTKFLKQIPLKTRTDTSERVNPSQDTNVSDWVNKDFSTICGSFYNAKDVEEFWRIVYISNKMYQMQMQDLICVSVDAFKQLVVKIKRGKVENKFGYFTGILRQKMRRTFMRNAFNSFLET
ncbi:helix-turn-helix domain-containing protein [Bacillus sp. 2205SS5-2]|uniref:helix-turn-helix domain-containing protein n=1 Tax=Bacillus sp. 2205SS5-2 TaxID=3109031 RepID=UPI003005EAFD